MHTTIIAEIGVNHNKDLSIAKELIDVAVDCGADIGSTLTTAQGSLIIIAPL